MSEFTASNGVTVSSETQLITGYRRINFSVYGKTETFEVSGPFMSALIESLDHEKDHELGRWRCPTETDWVAGEGARTAEGRTVVIVNERTLDRFWFNERVRDAGEGVDVAHRVGRAYFEAHPERKPAAEAKAGEVWELTIDDGSEHTVFIHEDLAVGGRAGVSQGGSYFDIEDSSNITSARKVWPEDAS